MIATPVNAAWAGPTPSAATVLARGVPFSTALNSQGPAEWFRFAEPLLPSDSVRLAVASDGGPFGTTELRLCLAPATDDFGQQDTQTACDGPGYSSDLPNVDLRAGKFRRTLVWRNARTNGFLLVKAGCGACDPQMNTVTVTLEAHSHAVVLGRPSARRAGRSWAVRAPARLTDGTRAPDGHTGYVRIRYDGGKTVRAGRGRVAGGQLRVRFTPRKGAHAASVRLCTAPIGAAGRSCSSSVSVRLKR